MRKVQNSNMLTGAVEVWPGMLFPNIRYINAAFVGRMKLKKGYCY